MHLDCDRTYTFVRHTTNMLAKKFHMQSFNLGVWLKLLVLVLRYTDTGSSILYIYMQEHQYMHAWLQLCITHCITPKNRYTVMPLHHYTITWLHHYTITRLHRYTVTRLHRYTVTRLHRYTVTRLHRYTVTPLHGYTVTPLHGYTVTPLHLTPLHDYTVTQLHCYTVTTVTRTGTRLHHYTVTPLHRYTVTKCSTTKLVRSDCFIRQHVSLRLHEVAQNPLPLPEPYDKLWLSVTNVYFKYMFMRCTTQKERQ